MTLSRDNRFFFVHVMKTGGTSFAELLQANFTPQQRYPDACITSQTGFFDRVEAYLHVPKLVASVNGLNGQLRMVLGHVPYAVRSLLEQDYVAMTLLRDPVDRTLSYLKHCRRYHIEHMPLTLEEIYEDAWFQASFICNYQTKIFSMSAQEALAETRVADGSTPVPTRLEIGDGQSLSAEVRLLQQRAPGRFSLECFAASTGVINIDESRLATAKKNLSDMEVVGVTEHYDRFVRKLVDDYGWQVSSIPHRHAGEEDAISTDFRNRIAADNAFDIELHEYAKSLSA
jgi:hypothetical protein